MTSHGSRPSGCTGYTHFEEELVNAMNDFVNAADAPTFDADGIVRGARRKRATAIAGVAAALVVAGGGTALATAVTNGSDAPKPAAAATATEATTVTTDEAATVLVSGSKYKIDLAGIDLDFAKQRLLKSQLQPGTVSEVPCGKNGKPGSVIAADPHSPKTVFKGDTVNLTICAD
ncbi:PASTA domain-containing protein [Streptomyces sp. NPDC102274]|uniref:PASTA domain-containing protein n=1 Tax=Streptomyces sp. NPDC102274 TaxID=3366151 RepID=UPI0037FC0450